MERKGVFIVFDGPGGCGKGTQVKKTEKLLQNNGMKVFVTREPGGIEAAEKIRQLIFSLKDKGLVGPEGQMMLFFAARKLWVDEVVEPNLARGITVISDRSYPATGAYQGYAEGGDQKKILKISDIVMGETKPDAVIYLDISPNTSMKRKKDPEGDPFDKEDKAYLERVIEGYRKMADDGWGGLKWYKIDGEPSIEEVFESVKSVLGEILGVKFSSYDG